MSRKVKILHCFILWLLALLAAATPAGAQGSADSMQMVRDQLRADKKLFVSKAMTLTESESKRFWPVYECYQKEFAAVSHRLAPLIEEYARVTPA